MKQKAVTAIIIAAVVLIVSGCSQPEQEELTTFPVNNQTELASKVSLSELTSETASALSSTQTLNVLDEFLEEIMGRRPVIKKEEKPGGPISVQVVYPKSSSLIGEPTVFRALAYSDSGVVDRVEFYLDGEKVHESSQEPYEWVFDPSTTTKSKHTLKVVARSGDYTDSDEINFYNVVQGSIVIYPWSPTAGNIPYARVKRYFSPEMADLDVAMFTKYEPGTFYLEFSRMLPPGYAYLIGELYVAGNVETASGEDTTLQASFYNYALKMYDDRTPYEIDLSGASTVDQTRYRSFAYSDPDNFTEPDAPGIQPGKLPFYAFDPISKQVKIRIEGNGPAKFILYPIVLKYYAYYDDSAPVVKFRNIRKEAGEVKVEVYVNEPAFVTVYAYDDANNVLNYKTEPKPEGWDEISVQTATATKVRVKVVDTGGHTTWSEYKSIP